MTHGADELLRCLEEIQLLEETGNSNDIPMKLPDRISNLQQVLTSVEFQAVTTEVKKFAKYLDEMRLGMGGDEKSMTEGSVRGRIKEIANKSGNKTEANTILQRLTDAKVFQLGMEIECLECARSSWYSVKDADYVLQCPKCLTQFSFPAASNEVGWSYRTLGPFSLPRRAHGAFTVLLTLRFFSNCLTVQLLHL